MGYDESKDKELVKNWSNDQVIQWLVKLEVIEDFQVKI
jgi:hypothetical protein